MSKTVNNRRREEKKIHKVGKEHPERTIKQDLKRINNIEDLENTNLDEVLDIHYTNIR
jgi:hypothetical protein